VDSSTAYIEQLLKEEQEQQKVGRSVGQACMCRYQ
jgi:hypothetical protein